MRASQTVPISGKRPKHLRRLKPIAIGLGLVLVFIICAALGLRAYALHVADQRLNALIGELDRKEPGWRWDDILASREDVPDEQNCAPHVVAAAKLLPNNWPLQRAATPKSAAGGQELPAAPPPDPAYDLLERLDKVEPFRKLGPELATQVRAELKALSPALTEARRVLAKPKGRYEVDWSKNLSSTRMPHVDATRSVVKLLRLDAAVRAEDGDAEGAFNSCRTMFRVGLSIGDEPTCVSQLVRMACQWTAIVSMERMLAQGEVSSELLAKAQRQLEEEAAQPTLLIAVKGERAAWKDVFERIYVGELGLEQLSSDKRRSENVLEAFWGWFYVRPVVHHNQVIHLELSTRVVEIAQRPRAEQMEAFEELNEDLRSMRASFPLAVLPIPGIDRVAQAYHREHAELECARVALAVERYRLAHGKWPASLEELTPAFLKEVPADPYGTGPVKYREFEEGVVVYSLGVDEEDNGGTIDRESPTREGADLGFRLWEVKRRGQPAAKAPAVPADD